MFAKQRDLTTSLFKWADDAEHAATIRKVLEEMGVQMPIAATHTELGSKLKELYGALASSEKEEDRQRARLLIKKLQAVGFAPPAEAETVDEGNAAEVVDPAEAEEPTEPQALGPEDQPTPVQPEPPEG